MKSKKLKKKASAHTQIQSFFHKAFAPERAAFSTDEQIAVTGKIVDPFDPHTPASLRAISKLVAMWEIDRVKRHLVRWPDGIVAVVQGDLSTEKSRREKLPWAYHIAFGKLLEKSIKFIDYLPGMQA